MSDLSDLCNPSATWHDGPCAEVRVGDHAIRYVRRGTGSSVVVVGADAHANPLWLPLIEILAAVRGSDADAVEAEFASSGYGDFKSAVGDAVVDFLTPVRERYAELRPDQAALESALAAGADKARAIATETLADVRDAMGVGPAR